MANSLEPDQTPGYSASGLVPSCLRRLDNHDQQVKGYVELSAFNKLAEQLPSMKESKVTNNNNEGQGSQQP